MEAVYGIIKYHPSQLSAASYAKQALAVLKDLERTVPESLPIFLAANSVLTLSGVRAYDAYHDFYDYMPAERIAEVERVLSKHGIIVVRSASAFAPEPETVSVFELVHEAAFQGLWQQYELPKAARVDETYRSDFDIDNVSLIAWSACIEGDFGVSMENGPLPSVWLNERLAPHTLRFGMMLGYPGKAIESCLWEDSLVEIGEDHETVEIDYKDYYFAAWPVYEIKSELRGDPEIMAHARLWSDILMEVYESDWHVAAKKLPAFKKALAYITDKEEGN